MAETFGFPPLKGTITHDEILSTLRDLVKLASDQWRAETDTSARMCARDIAAYIEDIEIRAMNASAFQSMLKQAVKDALKDIKIEQMAAEITKRP